jgi:hypothetical protein
LVPAPKNFFKSSWQTLGKETPRDQRKRHPDDDIQQEEPATNVASGAASGALLDEAFKKTIRVSPGAIVAVLRHAWSLA